eukprot:CAMPEP_0206323474 /NCGR_PEP_ID=MMETSP0106_2-20121207/19998_1 /ASSEMBLY_ACC=CAM_ASM_000206 /TAXON_ID=81532 /ORGANISM="Acanthoeca-like sp., Strain 10tr" /LENGTH=122 /DNA_ID=CAMNT_0053755755 /DNA_START=68 /DNA_END=436 /DNA_ORIENTATION=-
MLQPSSSWTILSAHGESRSRGQTTPRLPTHLAWAPPSPKVLFASRLGLVSASRPPSRTEREPMPSAVPAMVWPVFKGPGMFSRFPILSPSTSHLLRGANNPVPGAHNMPRTAMAVDGLRLLL